MQELSFEELNAIKPGEPITLATVLAVMAIGVLVVVVFKLFMSSSGSTKMPGGWSFDWKT